jgi:hypothetical protein
VSFYHGTEILTVIKENLPVICYPHCLPAGKLTDKGKNMNADPVSSENF